MGLDITAYSNLNPVGKHTDGWCENEEHVVAYAYNDFPKSFRGIPVLGERDRMLLGGCFEMTDETEKLAFCAGSYSGYNAWRDDLKQQFNPGVDPEAPFFELIWFADNEGVISSEASTDLLADFQKHADLYQPSRHEEFFRAKYACWTKAAELAATAGLIDFH